MRIRFILPLIFFLIIIVALWRGLSLHPNEIPSPLIGKAAPTIIANQEFKGKVTLLNVWASWCYACVYEHKFLFNIAQDPQITLVGLVYKDDPKSVDAFLKEQGNPYSALAYDNDGQIAIDWGVYGTPELFIIDKKGKVRDKHVGALDQHTWDTEIKPLVSQLQAEAP